MSEIEQEERKRIAKDSSIRISKCCDANHGFRCNWASPKGTYCYRKTANNRTPSLMQREGKTPICELFILRNPGYKKVK